MRNVPMLMLAATFGLAGCTSSADLRASAQAEASRDLADALKGRVAGAPSDCISGTLVSGPQIIDHHTLLYREGARTVWKATLAAECPSLDRGDTVIVEQNGSQLCRNDRFRPLDPGLSIPGAYCRFERFTPYRKP